MSSQTRRALIVIDSQNEYVTGNLLIEYPDIQLSLANIGRAIDAAGIATIPVIVVQQFAPAGSHVFAEGSHAWELHDVVRLRARDHYFEKKLPNAFTGTDLADWLSAHRINTLCVTGYMTHNCVDSTIKHAFHAGLSVEFLQDASGSLPYLNKVGTASAEEIHRAFCVVMQARFAAVMDTAEWIGLLDSDKVAKRDSPYLSNRRARNA